LRHDHDLPGCSRLLDGPADQRSLNLVESTTGDDVDLQPRKPLTAALDPGQLFWFESFFLRCREHDLLVQVTEPESVGDQPSDLLTPCTDGARNANSRNRHELQINDSWSSS
jgi:hypothetical protein